MYTIKVKNIYISYSIKNILSWREAKMRMKLIFKADKLPIIYRHRFMALIKDALNRSDADYKNNLYHKEVKYERVKPFAFGVCPPPFDYSACPVEEFEITVSSDNKSSMPPKVSDKVIPIKPDEHISMFISSIDFEFMTSLYNGFIDMQKNNAVFKFNDNIEFKFQRAFVLNEKKITSDEVMFKTLCPALLEEQRIDTTNNKQKKRDRYLLPPLEKGEHDERFNEVFTNIHNGILEDIRKQKDKKGHGLYKRPLEFIPIKLKKRVIKHTIRAFWEKNPDKPVMKFTCFEGCFKLKGDPRDLQMLYQIGIGLRTGQGFGMVDVV